MWNIDCVNYCKSALVILRVNLTERTFACFFFNFCRNVTELHHHSPLSGFPHYSLLFSPQMQQLCRLALTFLCTLSLAPSPHSLGCNETQYPGSHGEQSCCNKCRPGTATPATQPTPLTEPDTQTQTCTVRVVVPN